MDHNCFTSCEYEENEASKSLTNQRGIIDKIDNMEESEYNRKIEAHKDERADNTVRKLKEDP